MATSGISLSGFNGFDFGKIIEAIMMQESQPLTALQKQEQSLKDKDTALVDLGGQIAKLASSVSKLVTASAFQGFKVTSSDESVVKSTLGDSAIAGHYDVDITFLAKAQVTTSTNGYANLTDTVADGGSISFTIDGTTTTPIAITAATTLTELKDLINDQDSAVVASIVNDGTSNRLVISSRETGQTHGFTINSSLSHSGGTVVAFAAGQNATTGNTQNGQDAQFSVNGLSITSASNSIANAIPGVSLSLVKTGTASVDVETDHTALKDTIKAFIADYNKLRDFYTKQATTNPLTGQQLPLANDVILRQALSDIRATLLGANANGGAYSYLSEIGVEFEQSGQLKFVETTFNSAMGSHAADVKKLFQGTTGVEGAFDLMKTRLDNLDSTNGMIKMQRDSIDTVLDTYRDRVLAQEMRLEVRRVELTRMYAAADQAISQLNAMNAQLQSIRY